MELNFSTCLAATLLEEGGYSDNPADPGGATFHGVTQATYDKWRDSKGKPRQGVRLMEPDECDVLYHNWYWTPAFCAYLPAGVDMVHFDTAVNTGAKEAGFILQRAVNSLLPAGKLVAVDGDVGPATAAAVKAMSPSVVNALISSQANERLSFYKRLSTWATFGKGWTERTNRIAGKAHNLASAGATEQAAG